jgi:ribokinase
MPKVFTIGSGLVDVFVTTPDLQLPAGADQAQLCYPLGAKLSVDSVKIFSGGAGTNTAVAFARLGCQTAAIVELGQDASADLVKRELTQAGVDVTWVVSERSEQTGGSVILIGQDGARTVLVYRGAAAQLDVVDLPQEQLAGADWWHLSSLGGRPEVLSTLFGLARYHQRTFSWNPGKAELELLATGQLPVADVSCRVLILNREEWQALAPLQEELQSRLPLIVVTAGKDGGQIWEVGQWRAFTAGSAQSVDDTGAGDAFGAALSAGLLMGYTTDQALQWGVANASAVIQNIGAKPGLLTLDQLPK